MHIKIPSILSLWVIVLTFFVPCSAMSFNLGQAEGLFNVSMCHGLLARIEDRDKRLMAIANGGTTEGANFNDGNPKYDRVMAIEFVRGLSAATIYFIKNGDLCLYLRYDSEAMRSSKQGGKK